MQLALLSEEKKIKSIPDFEKLEGDRLEAAPNFCEKNEVIINVFGSPQPGQARKNLGIKRNKKLFTNLQTVINQDQKSLTLEVFSSYFKQLLNTRLTYTALYPLLTYYRDYPVT